MTEVKYDIANNRGPKAELSAELAVGRVQAITVTDCKIRNLASVENFKRKKQTPT